jgi:hypothetical protein
MTRFAGPVLASAAILALTAPSAVFAKGGDIPASSNASKTAEKKTALALSPKRFQEKQDVRDGRDGLPKDGPRDTGVKRGQDPRPVSP